MSVKHVIEVARGELGTTESPPGSNWVKYWEPFGAGWQGQPWCVAFLYWCFLQAGERAAFMGGGKTASCGILQKWYKAHGQTVQVNEVREGDIVLLNFHGGPLPEHCGIVTEVFGKYDSGAFYPDFFATIEGNTSRTGSQDNGGEVCEKRRYPSQVIEVCRPTYTPAPLPPDYEGHWAEESIRKAITKGIMHGYEDGSFQPDKPVTRAELATILDRLGVLECNTK